MGFPGTTIFGSARTAHDMSNNLREALTLETIATALLTPSGDEPLEWTFWKVKGVAVEYVGGLELTDFATGQIKDMAGRKRPDSNATDSFPSGHAATAFAGARLSNRNLDSIPMKLWARNSLKAGNFAMAGATAWARVEAGRHFPADVLAGAALGNFITSFVHDVFLDLPENTSLGFYLEPSLRGVTAAVSRSF